MKGCNWNWRNLLELSFIDFVLLLSALCGDGCALGAVLRECRVGGGNAFEGQHLVSVFLLGSVITLFSASLNPSFPFEIERSLVVCRFAGG